jgi:nuclear GTP-binding protein
MQNISTSSLSLTRYDLGFAGWRGSREWRPSAHPQVDLVPTWVTRRWVSVLSKEYPTLAFHASITKPFGRSLFWLSCVAHSLYFTYAGKGALITLLRQFAKLHSDKKNISVGFIGYPNTGMQGIS